MESSRKRVHVYYRVLRLHIPSLQLGYLFSKMYMYTVPVKYCVISLKQCIPVECFYKFNKVVKFEQFVWSLETCFMSAFFLEFQQVEYLNEHTLSILSLKHSRGN